MTCVGWVCNTCVHLLADDATDQGRFWARFDYVVILADVGESDHAALVQQELDRILFHHDPLDQINLVATVRQAQVLTDVLQSLLAAVVENP